MLSENLTKCQYMHVKQVQEPIKLKENETREESFCNGNCSCKNGKTYSTLHKGNLKLEKTLLEDKTS